jgi:hypothetical protein
VPDAGVVVEPPTPDHPVPDLEVTRIEQRDFELVVDPSAAAVRIIVVAPARDRGHE